jgi:hypothetical protein
MFRPAVLLPHIGYQNGDVVFGVATGGAVVDQGGNVEEELLAGQSVDGGQQVSYCGPSPSPVPRVAGFARWRSERMLPTAAFRPGRCSWVTRHTISKSTPM